MLESEIANLKGLSESQVEELQKKEGYNELPSSKGRSVLKIILEVFREPMLMLLLACGSIYFLLGDINEAIILLGFVFVVMGITIYQENKTERALEALRNLSSPRALVIRDGQHKRIAGREVVRGDIIILREGDRVPADGVILWELNFCVDESLLTGESVAVNKSAEDVENIKMTRPGGDNSPFVFSGTLVVGGQAIACVKEISIKTEMGKIGKILQTLGDEKTTLQKETGRIVKILSLVGLILCLIVIVSYGLILGNWLHGFLSGLTLAMAILPEEFPVVLTIFLALGAWRISKKNVLARRMSTIEMLGAAMVLCVDKTGTLTQNKMRVEKICVVSKDNLGQNKFYDLNCAPGKELAEEFHELIEFGILASKRDPFDPMEKALKLLGDQKLSGTEHIHNTWLLEREYPLSRHLMALSHVWHAPGKNDYIIAAKGAPEAIFDLCHFNPAQIKEIEKSVFEMANNGLRVLGIAKASFTKKDLPGEQHDFKFQFLGLIGLADPIRPEIAGAIKDCYSAGIKVVMITGDYPDTAKNIARQIGLKNSEQVITGVELEKLSEVELKEQVKEVNVFARIVPEQKLQIVNAFKARGEIVAMTGDGVNDAPALKAAHIGIAMGERGTDVAREASDMVLMDDNFFSIVAAIKMGRRIFDNLQKAMAYILAVHVPIAGLSLVPVVFNWPLILSPVHVVFLELIIDPACTIVFEAEKAEENVMQRSPRDPKTPLFSRRSVVFSLVQGLVVLIGILFAYKVALDLGQTAREARTLAFSILIIANISLIATNRSWMHTAFRSLFAYNPPFWGVVVGAFSFLLLAIYVPFLQNIFAFSALHFGDWMIALFVGMLSIFWFEIIKRKFLCGS